MSDHQEYINRIRGELDQWNSELARLEAHAHQAGEEARQKWETRKPRLEEVMAEMERRLAEARDHAGENWEASRARMEQGWQKISHELRELTERLFPGN